MKKFIIAALTSVCLVSCDQPATPDATPEQDVLLVHGGTILTMDSTRPTVDAMLVRGDEILAVGEKEILQNSMPRARDYDIQGRTIMPGVVDSHVHVHQLGAESLKVNLVGAESVEEMVRRIQDFYPNPASGAWLVGQGWDEGAWASKGYPDRGLLDVAFPDNPVLLQSLHGFAGFYNAAALSVAGVNAETPDPEVGQILRRADGSPTGVMLTLARGLVEDHAPAMTLDQTKRAILSGMNELARKGVTSIHEAGVTPLQLQAYRELADAGVLPLRFYGMLDGNDEALMARMFESGPLVSADGFFTVRGIKIFYDGSLGSRTALMRAPYSDKPDAANPTERISPARIKDLAENAARTGFQMAVHTIGDEGNDRILNIFDDVFRLYPDLDHRWRLEHAQVVLPDFYKKVAALNIISSMQPSHAVGDSDWAEDRVGSDRIRHAYAWRTIKEAGGKVIFNSDLPGEPWAPMQTLYFAVTRSKLDARDIARDGWYPDQAFTVEESLRAMTVDGAYAAFQDDKIGKLAPGYKADFIELSANPVVVSPQQIKDISVYATWVAGKKLAFARP